MITSWHLSNFMEFLLIFFLFALNHNSASAQSKSETPQDPQFILEEIVVVGDRS